MSLLCCAHEANRFKQARQRLSPTTAKMRFGMPPDSVVDRSRFGNIASYTNSSEMSKSPEVQLRVALVSECSPLRIRTRAALAAHGLGVVPCCILSPGD